LTTLALGIVFSATRRALWLWLWLWREIPVGSFAQIVGYLEFVESATASDASGADISVRVGALFLSGPIFLAVLIVIWAGVGLGRLATELRKQTRSRPPLTGSSSPTAAWACR